MPVSLKKNSLIILLLVFILPILADDRDTIMKTADKYMNAPYIKATVKQTNHYKLNNTTLTSTGTLYKENEIYLFDYKKPYPQFVKIDNLSITVYDSKMKTAQIIPNNASFNPGVIMQEINNRNFSIEKSKGYLIAKIKDYSEQIPEISVLINPDKLEILSFRYSDSMENKVNIELSSQDFSNHKKKLKTFTYPKGTQVFKQ